MAWNADFSGLSFLEESSKPKQEQEGLKKCCFFSNKEKMQLVYLPTNSSKVIQCLLFEEPLLYIPKKYMFPMVSRINSVNKNVQCPALDLHYPMTCQKIPGTVV